MNKTEALKEVLEIYGKTSAPVSSEFYQGLCVRAAKVIGQLMGEKSIPFAWWKDCPGLAQKVMERTIQRNESLLDINDNLVERLIELEEKNNENS